MRSIRPPCLRREQFIADMDVRIDTSKRILDKFYAEVQQSGLRNALQFSRVEDILVEENRTEFLTKARMCAMNFGDTEKTDEQAMMLVGSWLDQMTQSSDASRGKLMDGQGNAYHAALGQAIDVLNASVFSFGYYPQDDALDRSQIGPYSFAEEAHVQPQ